MAVGGDGWVGFVVVVLLVGGVVGGLLVVMGGCCCCFCGVVVVVLLVGCRTHHHLLEVVGLDALCLLGGNGGIGTLPGDSPAELGALRCPS